MRTPAPAPPVALRAEEVRGQAGEGPGHEQVPKVRMHRESGGEGPGRALQRPRGASQREEPPPLIFLGWAAAAHPRNIGVSALH